MSEPQFTPFRVAFLGALTFLCAVVFFFASLGGAYYLIHQNEIEQQRQGLVIEYRLCRTLDALASLTPPAGSPVTNPSRGYEQHEHAVLAQLGADVGCSK